MSRLLESILKNDYAISLNEADRHRVADLNLFPEKYISEARLIKDESTRVQFLRYYTAISEYPYLGSFEQQVFLLHTTVAAWKTQRLLMPDLTLQEQLRLSIHNLPLPGKPEEWMLIRPERIRWLSATNTCGAPVLVQQQVTYKTPVPEKNTALQYNAERLIPVSNLQVAISRWIAQRLARCMWQDNQFNLDAVRKYTLLRSLNWSAEALAAFDGLKKELKTVKGYSTNEVPGFVGPDEWYTAL